jgi:uncharacterized phage protein (TIGR02218 family)
VLYGARCQASEIAFREIITIDSQVGRTISAADFALFPDGYFAGGKVTWERSPGYFVRRGIKLHVSDEIVITHPIPELPAGSVLTVLPGCDHTLNHCGPKFANEENYGGFAMKEKNPFGQSSVF